MPAPTAAPPGVLVVNPGSSSCKLAVVDGQDREVAHAQVASTGGHLEAARLARAVERLPPFAAAAVRVVHGGQQRAAQLADRQLVERLGELRDLAPLHNPASVVAIRHLLGHHPRIPVVACFDGAFHTTIPDAAAVYPVPWEWTTAWGLRRVGFHGWSHAWAASRAAALLGRPPAGLRVVTCHLGAGASLAAVQDGRSVDTTMGFTPMDGLMMATRSGAVDPGLLLWIERHGHLAADAVERALDRESGLLGVSGVSSDMREVEAAAAAGDPRARLALAVYDHRLRAGIVAMVAAMGGCDAVAFTGGVGEGSARVRQVAAAGIGFLGAALDPAANDAVGGTDRDLSTPVARLRTLVVHARESVAIARAARQLLA